MEDAKRRAAIRVQAVKRKETDEGAMGTGSSKPSAKKRPLPKRDRAPKKQKASTEPIIGLMAEGTKTVPPAKHGVAKVSWFLHRAVKRNRPSYSVKIQSTLWRSFLQLLATRTMKTLETTRRRPWGRRASLALLR